MRESDELMLFQLLRDQLDEPEIERRGGFVIDIIPVRRELDVKLFVAQ